MDPRHPDAAQCSTTDDLLPHHREHLRASGLTDATIDAAQICSLIDADLAARLLGWSHDGPVPAIAIPYWTVDGGEPTSVVLRPDTSRARADGTAPKYESPVGVAPRLYLPPEPLVSRTALLDVTEPLLLIEGVKKALAAAQYGETVLSAQGVTVWHDKPHRDRTGQWRLHPDFAGVPLRGREVYIGFDGGDTTANPPVIEAEQRLARMLIDAGALVRVLRIPSPDRRTKVGLDDYLVTQTDPRAALQRLMDAALVADPLDRARRAMTGGRR